MSKHDAAQIKNEVAHLRRSDPHLRSNGADNRRLMPAIRATSRRVRSVGCLCSPSSQFRAKGTVAHADSVKRWRSATTSVTSTAETSRAWPCGKSVKWIRNGPSRVYRRVATGQMWCVFNIQNTTAMDSHYPEATDAVPLPRERWIDLSHTITGPSRAPVCVRRVALARRRPGAITFPTYS